ncbi:MAG: hypothetical protein R3A78_12235 [Polyangiales bacterium]
MVFVGVFVALLGCETSASIDSAGPSGASGTGEGDDAIPAEGILALDGEQTELYLRKLAPMLAGRVLSSAERERIREQGGAVIRPILEEWTGEPGFVQAARTMMEVRLASNGRSATIDYDVPGRTVAKVVGGAEPRSRILTATTCYDDAGGEAPCDTGAPYTAGVLTTRAYMASRAGRFNLTRAGTMMSVFACEKYPIRDELEPRIAKDRLLEMFRAESAEEQTVDAVRAGFGNGLACYSCHGQFSLHAQLFVKFDRDGLWVADANGAQSTEVGAQLGESVNGLMTSHLDDPTEMAAERSQVFDQSVQNLAEAARVLGESDAFRECAVKGLIEFALGLDRGAKVERELLVQIATRVHAQADDPTLQHLMVETFTDAEVAYTTVRALSPERGQ